MKDLSKILPADDYLEEYRQAMWESIIYHLDYYSASSKRLYIANPNKASSLLYIMVIFDEMTFANSLMLRELLFTTGLVFFKHIRPLVCLIDSVELEAFKNGKMFSGHVKYEDLVEITMDDVPDAYKLLR